MSPEIAAQKAIYARLTTDAGVTALVPSGSILDRNERPAPDPSIILGEGMGLDEGTSIARVLTRVTCDLHVWKKEPGLAGVKAIAGAIRTAIKSQRLALEVGFHCVDAIVLAARFMRDPDGETSHAVVTIDCRVEEIA